MQALPHIGRIRYHVGGIYAGERLVVRVFKKTRAAHGERAVYHIEQCQKVFAHILWQTCREEGGENGGVGGIAQCQRIEPVLGHEAVENIGTQHHRARYGYG